MKKKTGFTLAEVLITLTIIGVIAAITVPALIQRTNRQEYVTALQKAYSTLSRATNMIIAENGSPKCNDEGWACSSENIYNLYKKHLNIMKDCGSGRGCFVNQEIKYLNSPSGKAGNYDTDTAGRKIILADGTQVYFVYNSSANDAHLAQIFVDINGEKAPNTLGRDFFKLVLTSDGLKSNCGSTCDKYGWGCACKVLREGKMDY